MPAIKQIRNIIAGGERTTRELMLQASGGLLDKVLLTHRFGTNENIPEPIYQTLWPQAFSYPRVLTEGALEVVSSDPADADGGIGANQLLLLGCDGDGNPLMEIISMNGLDIVTTTNEFFWFEFAHVIKVGEPYGNTAGIITFTHTGTVKGTDNPLVGTLQAPYNRTNQAMTVIPNHYSGYLVTHSVAGDSAKQMEFAYRVTARNGVVQVVFPEIAGGASSFAHNNPAPERIHYPAMVEMVGRARSPVPTAISGSRQTWPSSPA